MIKVKDISQAHPGTCKHYVVTFDMGDGAEQTEMLHSRDTEPESGESFLRGWLKHQFKHGADKMKLKGKTVLDVEI